MISFIEAFRKELVEEIKESRHTLGSVPADRMGWQPNPKSMTIKALATHLAEIPLMIQFALEPDNWDFTDEPNNQADFPTADALLVRFDE